MKGLFRFCLSAALILAGAANAKAAEIYRINSPQSSITFTVHQFLGVTRGKFSQISGTIEIDDIHPERSSVQAIIGVKSIDTGIAKRDEHLCGTGFFDATKYPQITFKSQSVKQTGATSADITGSLTMHGVTRPIILHVTWLTPTRPNADGFRMRWVVRAGPIKRGDFGLRFSKAAEAISGIGEEVTVEISVEGMKSSDK